MNWHQWQEIIGVTGVFVLITVVLSIAIVQLASTWRAKAALAREAEYRVLADKAVRTQEETERQLRDVQDRLRSIEHVLKEVD
jgi:Flp pilus assembly protein TadB